MTIRRQAERFRIIAQLAHCKRERESAGLTQGWNTLLRVYDTTAGDWRTVHNQTLRALDGLGVGRSKERLKERRCSNDRQLYVASGFSRTGKVRLKTDTTYGFSQAL